MKRILNSIRYRTTKNNWSKLALENQFGVYLNGKFNDKELGLEIKRNEHEFILKGYDNFSKLITEGKADYYFVGNSVRISLNKLNFHIQTDEELFILKEVFLDRIYNYNLSNDKHNVIDIGMNIGVSSLNFASNPDVQNVFSFEPFEETIEAAQVNLNLNPHLKDKIISHNYGLGLGNNTFLAKYNRDYAGRMGLKSNIWNKLPDLNWTTRKVVIRDAGSELKRLTENSNHSWVLKIDCEGSELDIVNSLASHDMLKGFKVIVAEIHSANCRDKIEEMLADNNFTQFIFLKDQNWMLYAVRY